MAVDSLALIPSESMDSLQAEQKGSRGWRPVHQYVFVVLFDLVMELNLSLFSPFKNSCQPCAKVQLKYGKVAEYIQWHIWHALCSRAQ